MDWLSSFPVTDWDVNIAMHVEANLSLVSLSGLPTVGSGLPTVGSGLPTVGRALTTVGSPPWAVGCPLRAMAVLPSRKSDQEISKSDYYPTIFLPKIRPKEDPNLLIGIQIRLVQKLNSDIRQIDFYLEIVHI